MKDAADRSKPHVIVLMGVAGAGKTRVGQIVSRRLGWTFIDADDFHTAESIAAMGAGRPLSDADRLPWLERLADEISRHTGSHRSVIVACSALRASYREKLVVPGSRTVCIHLAISRETANRRLARRTGHFFPARLAESQFDALEPTGDGVLEVAADAPVEEVATRVLSIIERLRSATRADA